MQPAVQSVQLPLKAVQLSSAVPGTQTLLPLQHPPLHGESGREQLVLHFPFVQASPASQSLALPHWAQIPPAMQTAGVGGEPQTVHDPASTPQAEAMFPCSHVEPLQHPSLH
jgi:hypothetical protein